MKPNYTTIITPIAAGREGALKRYLHDHAEPRPGCSTNLVSCQSLFRFDKIKSLHFCSFVVLGDDGEFGPCLVFEATFDGPRADFLRELWRVAPEGMHAVYEHCVGYPECGLAVPNLIEEYLVRHDVGAHTFFSGCPGRSVAQVQGESRIRGEMVTFLSGRQAADATPATLAALQQTMQRDVIRSRPENRWAEQPAVTPWEIANRTWIVCAAALLALALVCGLVALVVYIVSGTGPFDVRDGIERVFRGLWQAGEELTSSDSLGWRWLGDLIRELQLPILYVVIVLAGAWFVVRIFELVYRSWTEDPRDQYFNRRFPLHIAVIFKYAIPVFLIGFAALGLVTDIKSPSVDSQRSQVRDFVQKLDRTLTKRSADSLEARAAETPAPAPLASIVMILGVGLVWVLLQHWATSLKLAVQFRELTPTAENLRRFVLDVVRFAMVIAVVTTVLIAARHIPGDVAKQLGKLARPTVETVLVLAVYALVGVLAVYSAAFILFFIVRARELAERHFRPAEELTTQPLDNAHSYAREEGGINRHQNHLASLTYVKPGFLRRWLLRTALFFVNLLSRFWFNRGELGGIPTILSARWVMIDNGRRLLFLDNYSGSWDSYLNEFIDMGAVKGLNAIWSNTFIKAGCPERRHAYPETRFYFWQGAQAEQAFKAYVRQSQIETIVWYGAYPTLSITNINANTELRQSLFEPMAECDLDAVIQRL